MTTGPIGVVVPVYGHSLLAAEAVQSALDQDAPEGVRIVAVNDGCRLAQTEEVLSELALAHPDRVDYVRRPNGGLSAARNTGIRHLLRHAPDVESIYLLDADNYLEPGALRRAAETLRAHPEAGWVYPDVDMFGLAWQGDFAGAYSLLTHTMINVSEAGSLVRAEVFRDGVLFDEEMRQGYEDWEFFLRAAEAGWTGVHLPSFGFRYRKRAESMVSESHQLDAQLRAEIARRRKALFHPATMVELEARTAPRYALASTAARDVRLLTDPDGAGERIPFADFEKRFWANLLDPTAEPLPAFLVVAAPGVWRALGRSRMAHGVLWRLERHLVDSHFAAVRLRESPIPGLSTDAPAGAGAWRAGADIVMVRTDVVRQIILDPDETWLRSIWSSRPQPRLGLSVASLPGGRAEQARRTAAPMLRKLIDALAGSRWADARGLPRRWKSPAMPERNHLALRARAAAGGAAAPIAPRRPDPKGRNVAFVLPIYEFGGVERVTRQVARVLAARGFRPHLVIWSAMSAPGLARGLEPFESVSFMNHPPVDAWSDDEAFLGMPLGAWRRSADEHGLALGLLASMDAVVLAHAHSAAAVAGRLRRLGVAVLDHVHVMDQTPRGRPSGHPTAALAYDHALDRIIACSHTLAAWLEGMGAPAEKIVTVPNGPGFEVDMARAERAAAAKAERSGPLRVLFVGRLDRQKGLERVLAVARHFELQGRRDIEIRVVGAGVLERDGHDRGVAASIDWRPKTLDEDELMDHYEWADVMLLLSHWEGLPLSIIEAQLFGAAPLATRIGAVEEAVEHGVTGWLVDPDNAVHETIVALQSLLQDRTPLAGVAARAHAAARLRSWDDAVAPLAAYLGSLPGPPKLPPGVGGGARRRQPRLRNQ